ncbi:MAG: spore cortex biosynthesis protein YabQ [Clostridia bacterium]|nr:spore cortex biosynthesis protein YabQ [Clostridia bacterium]
MRFFIFMICLFVGIVSGVVYDVLYVARVCLCGVDKKVYTVKDRVFIAAADILYCLVFAAGFIFTSVMFDFEGLRLYMLAGCLIGALLYLKSFHLIVAFSAKKVYNKVSKYTESKSGRTKEKPHRRGNHGKRNNLSDNSGKRSHLSAGGNSRRVKKARRIKSGNRKNAADDRR